MKHKIILLVLAATFALSLFSSCTSSDCDDIQVQKQPTEKTNKPNN